MRVMRSPRSVDVAITGKCNLRCSYCSHFSTPNEVDRDLPGSEWLRFFEELGRLAVMEVILLGGEPFLRKDLPDLLQSIVRNRMRFSILSNGTLITRETAAFLASTRRCEDVQVSIDGSRPQAHDACRGDGNFQRAVNAIDLLRTHGVNVSVRVTLHRHNVYDLEETAKLLLEEMGLPAFSTNAASYLGLCRESSDRIALTTDERSYAMETLLRLNARYSGRIFAQAGPLAEAGMWLEMERARRSGVESIPGRGCLAGCNGASRKLAVRADGVIIPCSLVSHLELGRINEDDLAGLWQHHPELTKLRTRYRVPLSDFTFCQDCPYVNYCTGNCPALAFTLTGREDHPSPDACLRQFLEQGGRLPHATWLTAHDAPAAC